MHVWHIDKWFWTRDIISLWVLWCHACWSPRWLVRNLKSKLLRFASNMWTWHTMRMFTLSIHLHVSKPLLPWSILACPPQHWMSSQSPHSTHSTGNWMISVQSNLWMSVTFLKWKDLIQKTRTCLFKSFYYCYWTTLWIGSGGQIPRGKPQSLFISAKRHRHILYTCMIFIIQVPGDYVWYTVSHTYSCIWHWHNLHYDCRSRRLEICQLTRHRLVTITTTDHRSDNDVPLW